MVSKTDEHIIHMYKVTEAQGDTDNYWSEDEDERLELHKGGSRRTIRRYRRTGNEKEYKYNIK